MNLAPGHMGIARGEALVDAAEPETDFGRHAGLVLLDHFGAVAPGEELGVSRHVGDQGIHLFGAVPDQDGLVDCFHRMGTSVRDGLY